MPSHSPTVSPMSMETARWTAWLAAHGVRSGPPPLSPPRLGRRSRLIVARRDPRTALAAWAGAWVAGWDVFLADPAWGESTRGEFCQRVGADAVSADEGGWEATGGGAEVCFGDEPIVAIPTGGSSGQPKLAVHTADTLAASARAGVAHLGGGKHRALSLLPVHHVSGLMPAWRAAVSDGEVVWADWPTWRTQADVPKGFVISLVPTQLARLRESDPSVAPLAKAGAILLGGAAADPALLAWGRQRGLRLAPCYGMTETAAFVAACRPEEFLSGRDDLGTAVPGTKFSTDAEGRLHLESPGLFLGYWPEKREAGSWATSDAAELLADGRLKVRGRLDDLINCGGEKASPGRIEAFLRGTGLVRDAAVFGEADPVWGQRVAAAVVLAEGVGLEQLSDASGKGLPPWERPKRWVVTNEIPRTMAGKVDRAGLNEKSFDS